MHAAVSSSATSVSGGALLRVVWASLFAIACFLAKKELEKRDLDLLRRRARDIFFQVVLWPTPPNDPSREAKWTNWLAQRLGDWLDRNPRIPPDTKDLFDPKRNTFNNVRDVLIRFVSAVWGAYTTARLADRTLQFGMWIRCVGISVIVLGVQVAVVGDPWAIPEIVLGIAVAVAGHYLGALRSRRRLWLGLAALAPVTILTGSYDMSAATGFFGEATVMARQAGSLVGGVAAVAVALGKGGLSPSITGVLAWPRVRAVRRRLVLVGVRSAGVACLCYAVANLIQAVSVSPSVLMQGTHALIALFLAMAAFESRHPTTAYPRLVGLD